MRKQLILLDLGYARTTVTNCLFIVFFLLIGICVEGGLLSVGVDAALLAGLLACTLVLLVGGEGLLGSRGRIGTNGFVDLLVELLKIARAEASSDVLGKVRLVHVRVLFLHFFHVVVDMTAEDTLVEGLGVVFLGFAVVAREALFVVRDVEAAVGSTLHDTENTVASGGGPNANIKVAAEGALVVIKLGNVVGAAVHFGGNNG